MLTLDFMGSFGSVLFDPYALGLAALGVFLGIILGALPGVSSTMALAILLPVSFYMTPYMAILFLISVFVSSVYGGSVSAILINIPGTPAAIVTQLDGYPMSRSGKAGYALTYALVASTFGGFIGLGLLILLAPLLASAASNFGSPEFAMVALFGLVLLAYASQGSTGKAIVVGAAGVVLSMIGFDSMTDTERLTSGLTPLQAGLDLVPVIIGLFGLAEVMRHLSMSSKGRDEPSRIGKIFPPLRTLVEKWKTMLRGSLVGIFVGAIPAAGSAVAVSIAYAQEQRFSKNKNEFGKGCSEGIMAPESANSSSVAGSLIPMMTLGVPGDTITAVLMGALLIHGLQPGPLLFTQNPEFVSSVYASVFLGIALTFIIGLVMLRWIASIMRIPSRVLMVLISLLCVIGAFAIRNDINDVYVMAIFGLIGYVFYFLKLPVAPLAFGIILGPILEENLRRSLMLSQGSWSTFIERPISGFLLLASIAAITSPLLAWGVVKLKKSLLVKDGEA